MGTKSKKEEFLVAYDELSDAVFRHCLLRVRGRDEAVDIMQETFTKVWDYLRKGAEVKNMKALVFTTANNLIIDWYRKKKPYSLSDEEALRIPDDTIVSTPEARADAALLLKKLAKLEEPYKRAIELRFIEGLGPKEIAEVLDESENTVSVRIHRGLKRLKEIFDGDEPKIV